MIKKDQLRMIKKGSVESDQKDQLRMIKNDLLNNSSSNFLFANFFANFSLQ